MSLLLFGDWQNLLKKQKELEVSKKCKAKVKRAKQKK
jgi:hypothetical protein